MLTKSCVASFCSPPGTTFDSVTLTCEAANFCPAGFYDAATQDFARGFYTNGQGICEPCVDMCVLFRLLHIVLFD